MTSETRNWPSGETARPGDTVQHRDPSDGRITENLTVERIIPNKAKARVTGWKLGRSFETTVELKDLIIVHRAHEGERA